MDLALWCTSNICIVIVLSLFYENFFVLSESSTLQKEMEVMKDYGIYYSFNRTKEILMSYYDLSDEIKVLMDEFDFRCTNTKLYLPKRYPFITIEGAYRKTRSIVAQRIARRIRARVVGCPPQFMTMSSYVFNDTIELRRAFYSLAVHATACCCREFLSSSPVIVAGYWIDQSAFGIAKMFGTLPLKSSPLYEWPTELLKPDRVYLINPVHKPPLLLHPYKPLKSYSFKDKLLDTMMRFKNPPVSEVRTTINYEDMARMIIQLINTHFSTTYNIY